MVRFESRCSLDCELVWRFSKGERDVPWIAWDPYFREAKDVDAFLAGILDDGDCLFDGTLEVEPDWFCLDGAQANGLFGLSHAQ